MIQAVLQEVFPKAISPPVISALGAALGAAILWRVLRARVVAPCAIWIVLATLFVGNVVALTARGLFLSVLLERTPDVASELTRDQLTLGKTAGLASAIIQEQATLFCGAMVAYALRQRGPTAATKLGRAVLIIFTSLILLTSFGMLWFVPRMAYELASGVGQTTLIDGPGQVTLLGDLGVVAVPSGWRGDSSTRQPPAPAVFFVSDDLEIPIPQTVVLFDASDEATTPMTARRALLVSVFDDPDQWRRLRSSQASGTTGVTVPDSLLNGRGTAARLRTTPVQNGHGWRSMLRVAVPDSETPCTVTVLIRHETETPPALERFYSVLGAVRLRD